MNPDPTRKDLARILRNGTDEIRKLRSENELLAAQVRVIDVFDRALRDPRGGYATADDPAYMLGRLAEHFDKPEPTKGQDQPLGEVEGDRVDTFGADRARAL